MMLITVLFLALISSITSCPLKTVDIRSGCYCGIEIDGTNYIHCHPYTINEIPQFTRSYVHEKLNLSQNFIENLTNQSFEHLKVKRIYLENNPIRFIDQQTFHPNLLHYLEEFYLQTVSNHNLEFFCYGKWKKLRILKLIGFNINQFSHCFERLDRLEKLIIEKSQIDLISHHIYKLPFLSELSLINNQIEVLQFDEEYLSHSSSIRILNLTSNQLQTIPNDLYLRLPHLTTLDLSHNRFEIVPIFNHITTLNVNLSSNLINYIQINQNQHIFDLSFNPICTIERSTTDLSNVILHNPTQLHCDCRLAYVLETNSSDQLKIFNNQTVCSSPEQYQGRFLKDLTYEQLRRTCSNQLPKNCKEVSNFQAFAIENSTQNEDLTNRVQDQTSFRLISFYTLYEDGDLLIFWDFDHAPFLSTKLQITIEQNDEIIRRTDYLSPFLKQYMISHLTADKTYYVCLLITRLSIGTDKYCRQTRTSNNQTFLQILFVNRSLIFGFVVGTILTTSILITLAFICHLHYKQKDRTSRERYMYMSRNELNESYSHSILSSKYQHLKLPSRQTYLNPMPPWYHRTSRQLSTNRRSPCWFLQYHQRTLSDSTTTNRLTSLASDYSNGIEKEQMTSTSLMSNMSFDEHPSTIIQTSLPRHVYEELNDTNIFL